MMYQKSYVRQAASNDKVKPKEPQIEIKNEFKKDMFVNALELTLDPYFNIKGNAIIQVNGNNLIDSDDSTQFRNWKLVQIPLHEQVLQQDQSIQIFIWNGQQVGVCVSKLSCVD